MNISEKNLIIQIQVNNKVQWKLDIADTSLAENLGLEDTFQKIWATVFYYQYISPLEIAENLDLSDKGLVTVSPLNRAFTAQRAGIVI